MEGAKPFSKKKQIIPSRKVSKKLLDYLSHNQWNKSFEMTPDLFLAPFLFEIVLALRRLMPYLYYHDNATELDSTAEIDLL